MSCRPGRPKQHLEGVLSGQAGLRWDVISSALGRVQDARRTRPAPFWDAKTSTAVEGPGRLEQALSRPEDVLTDVSTRQAPS